MLESTNNIDVVIKIVVAIKDWRLLKRNSWKIYILEHSKQVKCNSTTDTAIVIRDIYSTFTLFFFCTYN